MRIITIKNKYGNLTAEEGKTRGARLEWQATNELQIYVSGTMKPIEFEQAGNLALNIALGMHIPAIALRRVGAMSHKRPIERKHSRRMF